MLHAMPLSSPILTTCTAFTVCNLCVGSRGVERESPVYITAGVVRTCVWLIETVGALCTSPLGTDIEISPCTSLMPVRPGHDQPWPFYPKHRGFY